MIVEDEKLVNTVGGAVSYSLINSITKMITVVLELGRTVGSAIKYGKTKTKCR